MKKRLISFILLAVIMTSLVSVSAFAQPAVAIHTLAKGDTIVSLCQRYGVDYQQYRTLIMALNSVSSESDFGKMPVGAQVVIPVSAAAAAAISGAKIPAGSAGSAIPAVSPTPVVGAASDVVWGDSVNCYIVSYTVKAGDTIIGIYRNRDLSYKTYSNLILKLNNMKNFNSLRVGKTLLLPVAAVREGDQVVYTIMNHVMKSGETVYGVVSNGYGLNYKDNVDMLKNINAKENLGSFKVGETLHIAVNGYMALSTGAVK